MVHFPASYVSLPECISVFFASKKKHLGKLLSFLNLNDQRILGGFPYFSPPFGVTNRRERLPKICPENIHPFASRVAARGFQNFVTSKTSAGYLVSQHCRFLVILITETCHTVDGWNPAITSWYVVLPIIYIVFSTSQVVKDFFSPTVGGIWYLISIVSQHQPFTWLVLNPNSIAHLLVIL